MCSCVQQRPELPHFDLTHDYSCELPTLRYAEGGRLLKLSFARSKEAAANGDFFYRRPEKRGACKGFSDGSRRRMMDKLNTISVAATLPTFVTMTLPDDVFVESPTEFSKQAKFWKDSFTKRLTRVCPAASAIWRIEWQTRKSGVYEGRYVPHFHLMIFGLPQRDSHWHAESPVPVTESYVDVSEPQVFLDFMRQVSVKGGSGGSLAPRQTRLTVAVGADKLVFEGSSRFVARCSNLRVQHLLTTLDPTSPDDRHKMSFADWASLAWYNVVGSHNTDHLKAGVRCERVRSWGGVMSYTAKYMSKADGESMGGVEMGRQWGIHNRKCIPWAKLITLQLDNEVGVRLRRVARKYLEKRLRFPRNYPYGITLYANPESFRRLWEHAPPDPF